MVAEALSALALVTGAGAPATYAGKSDQGLPASAVVRNGKIDRIKLMWSAPCSISGWVWGPQGTIWFNRKPAPFSISGKRYSDEGRVSRPFQIGNVVLDQKLSGRFGKRAISGVQRSTVHLYDATGKLQDSCKSTVRFSVTRKPPAGRARSSRRP